MDYKKDIRPMRVIGGKAKRLLLKTIEGTDTRPTTDRIKETLFNMLAPSLCDCCFMDLFAGSGGIGIEALSRGARKAVFIEANPRAAECIRQNLLSTHLEEEAAVMTCDALAGLSRLEDKAEVFDLVFLDPPYGKGLEREVLEYLAGSKIISQASVLIIEAALDTDFGYAGELGYEIIKEKKYKTNKHVFLQKKQEEENS